MHVVSCGEKVPKALAHNANDLHLSPRVDRVRPLSDSFDTSFRAGEVWAGCGPSLAPGTLSGRAWAHTAGSERFGDSIGRVGGERDPGKSVDLYS